MIIEDLRAISAETFYEGMYIDSEIYFRYNNTYIMLCKNVNLTPHIIMQLRQHERSQDCLYVGKNYIDDIVTQSDQFKNLYAQRAKNGDDQASKSAELNLIQKINIQKEYHSLRNKIVDVMETAKAEGQISLQANDAIAKEVNERIEHTDPAMLIQCINNLRNPDDYLHTHSTNVGLLNGMIGRWLNLPGEEVDTLIKAGLSHDLGKLRIPEEILNKPGSLTEEEFKIIMEHPIYSYDIMVLSGEKDPRILHAVRGHHERVNGTGYPDKLQTEDIGQFARITAVSDVYDAMVAKRPYKEQHSPFEILAEFSLNKFSNLDIQIVNVFLENMPEALLGKRVQLSDGKMGDIVHINRQNYAFPIVEVDGNLVTTNATLRCIGMNDFLTIVT